MRQPLAIETSRLGIRWLGVRDAAFILRLVNDTDWLRFIGDKKIRDLDDARAYLESGPMQMYDENGFGLNRIGLLDDDRPIGICGILKRDRFAEIELGFALLPEYRGLGYAYEASSAILQLARAEWHLARVAAILHPDNTASRKLLLKLGFQPQGQWRSDPDSLLLDYYSLEISIGPA